MKDGHRKHGRHHRDNLERDDVSHRGIWRDPLLALPNNPMLWV
jgi:hypothetical protein